MPDSLPWDSVVALEFCNGHKVKMSQGAWLMVANQVFTLLLSYYKRNKFNYDKVWDIVKHGDKNVGLTL